MAKVSWNIPKGSVNNETFKLKDSDFSNLNSISFEVFENKHSAEFKHKYMEYMRNIKNFRQSIGTCFFNTLDSSEILIEEIGCGGSASVYSVTDNESGKSVVVKMVSFRLSAYVKFAGDYILPGAEFDNAPKINAINKQLNVFFREAEIISSKKGVYGIPSMGDNKTFVIEVYHETEGVKNLFDFVIGIPMEMYEPIIYDKPWEEKEALKLATDILKCLKAMHSEYIHRDIKPENIMKRKDGGYVLIDWGGSKKINSGETDIKDLTDTENLMSSEGQSMRIPSTICFSDSSRIKKDENGSFSVNAEYEKCPMIDLYSLGVVMAFLVHKDEPGEAGEDVSTRCKKRLLNFRTNGRIFALDRAVNNCVEIKDELFYELECSDRYKEIVKRATVRHKNGSPYTTADEMLAALGGTVGDPPVEEEKPICITPKLSVISGLIIYVISYLVSLFGGYEAAYNTGLEILFAVATAGAFYGIGKLFEKKLFFERKDIIYICSVWVINVLISFITAMKSMVCLPAIISVAEMIIIFAVYCAVSRYLLKGNIREHGKFKVNVLLWAVYIAAVGICLGLTVSAIPALAAKKISLFMNFASVEIVVVFAFLGGLSGATAGAVISMAEIAAMDDK